MMPRLRTVTFLMSVGPQMRPTLGHGVSLQWAASTWLRAYSCHRLGACVVMRVWGSALKGLSRSRTHKEEDRVARNIGV